MSLLGIDMGTSGCKAIVFSEEGQVLAAAYQEYDYQRAQPGWAELDSIQVWGLVKQTIRKAVSGAAHDPVKALCVSSLGETVVPVTADRRIIGPALLNFDVRGAEFLPELRERLSDARLYRLNGNTLGNHYSLTKLLWLKRYQPELYQQADWFLHWSGFIAFMLGAQARIDYSLANRTLLFDLDQSNWSQELLGLAQIDGQKLPPPLPSGEVIGTVSGEIAQDLGLADNALIINGAHDQCCNGVGCGVIEPGRAMYGMGTYLCMMPVFAQRPEAAAMMAQGLNTEQHAMPGQFVSFIYNQGGVLVKWFRDTFASAERKQAEAAGEDIYAWLTAEMPAGPSRVMALPHFTVTGPPQFIDDSCGVVAGLTLDTTRGEILKGLIEATTFYIRACFEALPAGITISEFRAAGGGSKSEAWLQICADILGRPFLRPEVNEAGALGAAILAGKGSGISPSLEAGVERMVKFDREYHPNPQAQQRYTQRFEKYQRLWPLMQDYLRELALST